MRECKSAKDINGKTIRVGDSVEAQSIYDSSWGQTCRVIRIHQQGADGTILTLDPVPFPEFKFHNSHQASKSRKVSK